MIIYTSQDEVFAEPILREFEKQTGIEARPVYDSEAVKTVGLVNRLLTEREHPQCDVFWNNEEFRTRQLAARGVFRETNGWTRLGYRTRRIVINTNLADGGHGAARVQRRDQRNVARQGRPGLSAFWNDGDAFPRAAAALGGRGLAGMVPRAGGQQTVPGGRQFGRGQDGGAGRGVVGFYGFGRHRGRATGRFSGGGAADNGGDAVCSEHRGCHPGLSPSRRRRSGFTSLFPTRKSPKKLVELRALEGARWTRPRRRRGLRWIGTNCCATSTP